jgi:hypothetical protein
MLTDYHKKNRVAAALVAVLQVGSIGPDLAPSDYHLFSKLKESLAGKNFRTMMRFKTP